MPSRSPYRFYVAAVAAGDWPRAHREAIAQLARVEAQIRRSNPYGYPPDHWAALDATWRRLHAESATHLAAA